MFSLALVCLLVSRIMQKLPTNFHRIRWKGGTWAMEETIGF